MLIFSFQEPVQIEADILKFCNETGVPVALDETLDIYQENVLDKLQEFLHPGIVAIVSFQFHLEL